MNSRLFVIGDSFVFGLLKDYDSDRSIKVTPFGEILSQYCKKDYHEMGICGGTNQDIYQVVIDYFKIQQQDKVIVSWTGTQRSDTSNKIVDPIPPIIDTTNYLNSVGCDYYYVSSFIDYRLANVGVPDFCTKKWLWWYEEDQTLYDQCLTSDHDLQHSAGSLAHGNRELTHIFGDTLTKLTERFQSESAYLGSCNHPNRKGHQLIAKNIYREVGENLQQ